MTTTSTKPDVLHFKSNDAALEYAGAHLENEPQVDAHLPAIVVAQTEGGLASAYTLRIGHSRTGIETVIASPTSEQVGPFVPGDLVSVWIRKLDLEASAPSQIVGVITGKLEPTFHVTKGWKSAVASTSPSQSRWRFLSLNRPIKRVGLLIMLAGLALSALGVLQLSFATSHLSAGWWRAVSQEGYYGRRHWQVAWGAYLTVAGFMLSFTYDATIARLVSWVSSRRE